MRPSNLSLITFTLVSAVFLLSGHWLDGLSNKFSDISNELLTLQNIEFRKNKLISDEELKNIVRLAAGDSIYDMSLSELEEVMTNHRWIESVDIDIHSSPTRLLVSVSEEVPWLVLHGNQQSWVASRSNRVLSELSEIKYPNAIMSLSEIPRLGVESYLEKDVEALEEIEIFLEPVFSTLKCIEQAGGFEFEVSDQFVEDERSLSFNLDREGQSVTVVFPVSEKLNCEDKLEQLSMVFEDLARKREVPYRVDLRFDSQVVVRK